MPEIERAAPPNRGAWFDIVFGVVLPIGCLVFDPIVFRGGGFPGMYATGAYVFVGLQIAILLCWMLLGRRMDRGADFFPGPLLAGGVFSLLLGIAMLPLSLMGLVMVIGILGFTPFLTSLVYFRAGFRAFQRRGERSGGFRRVSLIVLGMLFAVAPSLVIQPEILGGIVDILENPGRYLRLATDPHAAVTFQKLSHWVR